MRFADRLRQLRDEAGLSEAKLAKASGLTFGTLHAYGLGKRAPSFAAVVKIAAALNGVGGLKVTCESFADCEDIAGRKSAKRKKRK